MGDESESGECDDDGLASWLAESLSHSLFSRRLVGRFMGDTEDDDDDEESIDDDV